VDARKPTPDAGRRSQASRAAILTAALDLVQEVGYARLSIEGIAARAGVGKQTIYRWWRSKGAVLLDSLLALSEGQDGEVLPLPDTGDLEADLKLVLRATVAEMSDPRYDRPMRALATEIGHDPALAEEYAVRLDGPLRRRKTERLRSAQRAGQLPDDLDLDVAIDMIWVPLLHRWMQRSGPLTADYASAVVDSALDGLRAR
jgi:AcrR family transcriptional regulator